ncbi:hypothetical protein LP114_061 [Listeria phage LP-114]|uniref:Uncharacterized protein n=1 Tax=Listeria phage LP-114 TaxID=1458857 RepID=A0A059T640_9CAUD|nr:hypothetical protein LP114_061 [Listeria phage LP-114]AHL18649.1 hypothetical protein LP114_061 [Listeria phage LP-114]
MNIGAIWGTMWGTYWGMVRNHYWRVIAGLYGVTCVACCDVL